jgi:hypothetical protein
MPWADWALALGLAALTVATRWPYRARILPTWDSVQFGLALGYYDIVRHQPHPPGYILYVTLGRLMAPLLGDAAATLAGLAVGTSALTVLLLYRLGWSLDGRGTATIAALGLVSSPLFWAYGVVGLPYAAEAVLATGVALGAWGMREGRVRALVGSALLLGFAGGVRQSMLLILAPLWVGMAWCGFRRRGPVLAGLGLIGLATVTWLGPMLWLTGVQRYIAASVELYESTIQPTTLFGGGAARNVVGLGEALLVGVGLFLPALAWGLRRVPVSLWRGSDHALFFALWTLPALAVYALVHLGQPGYLLTILPACYLVVGRVLMEFGRPHAGAARPSLGLRPALATVVVLAALGGHAAFVALARPVDVPLPAAAASWEQRVAAELRARYRFRIWNHTAAGLAEREAVVRAYVEAIRREFDPRDTVLVTELGNPRSYPWFRHVTYYLPEYTVYHLRLGETRPGYLVSHELTTMSTIPERRVSLPLRTRRLVWVVDEWHPGLPRPATLEARSLPHGRSLYVLQVRRRVVEHAGYHLVPVTSVARLR